MPVPERKFTQDFFDVNPQVIPVKFSRPKGKGTPGTLSWKGFEGYELIKIGTSKWSVVITEDFTVKCLGDGYAEIPDTENNRKKLSKMLKPTMSKPTYDRGISVDLHDPTKMFFKDNKGIVKPLTEEALDKGELRLIDRGTIQEPVVTKLKSLRVFDVKNARSTDSDLAQRIRPWLQKFVKVDQAIMEAAAI